MKVAIMQPYFFPYIGYFQLINAVDKFVVYDNIQYTKKGWINRNRILVNGKAEYISVSIKKDSDYLDVNKRHVADTWNKDKNKLLNKIREAYRKAPFFKDVMPLIEDCVNFESENLFDYLFNSLKKTNEFLGITTPLIQPSTLSYDNELKAEEKVISICKSLKAESYINPIGGVDLYEKEHFLSEKIKLSFLQANNVKYSQFKNEFAPFLSIIDVMMFNGTGDIKKMLPLCRINYGK